jgi:autotransporter-associated beta strand protein
MKSVSGQRGSGVSSGLGYTFLSPWAIGNADSQRRQYLHRRHHNQRGKRANWQWGTAGSIVGDVANNTRLTFNRTNFELVGSVTGAGALSQIGTGTLFLGGNNTYSGTTYTDESN